MLPNLIGLTGAAGSGKDTIAAELRRYGYQRVAFADPLKRIAYDANPLIDGTAVDTGLRGGFRTIRLAQLVDLVGWDEAKIGYPDVRAYLQNFGVAVRNQAPNFWADLGIDTAKQHARAVITDVRFGNEFDAVCAAGGVTVRLIRPGHDLGANAAHVSETEAAAQPVHVELKNLDRPAVVAARLLDRVAAWAEQ